MERANYEKPQDVLNDDALGQLQKSQILARWAYDELRLMTSSYEGMGGGHSSQLKEVMEALREVTPSDVDEYELSMPQI